MYRIRLTKFVRNIGTGESQTTTHNVPVKSSLPEPQRPPAVDNVVHVKAPDILPFRRRLVLSGLELRNRRGNGRRRIAIYLFRIWGQ